MKNRKDDYTNMVVFISVIFIVIAILFIFTLSKSFYNSISNEDDNISKNDKLDSLPIQTKKGIKLEAVPIQSKEDGKAVKPTEMKVFVSKDGNKKEVTEQGKISKSEKGSFMSWSLPEEKQNLEVSYKRQLEYIVTYSDGQTKMFTHKQ